MEQTLLISLNFYIIFFLIIWFDGDITNILSRCSILRKLFRRSEYEKFKLEEDVMASYPEFLNYKYPSFMTKLLSCPICLTFWLTLILNSLGFYYLSRETWLTEFTISFPIYYFVNLLLHLIIKKLLST